MNIKLFEKDDAKKIYNPFLPIFFLWKIASFFFKFAIKIPIFKF